MPDGIRRYAVDEATELRSGECPLSHQNFSPLTRSLPLSAVGLLFVLATPSSAQDMAAGRTLAGQRCQTCHGLDGIAKMPIAPHLAGESAMYLQTQLKAFRSGARQHEMMTIVAKDLSDKQVADLAAWYEAITITATMPEQ
ncbi:cytochrome c [Mesorhizobium sp. LHD-90]|uniref:c-type cytochrome n=1 Tax=Mesorhizobium sp. LHD-90 TaxID=3071414 RepID=UPI0027E08668|nr:cytochrome c [Mesorhizobium sp. LHD-90]MDQ6437624.1 cytochrome c [Mesorhizobium sp. LHD-90]